MKNTTGSFIRINKDSTQPGRILRSSVLILTLSFITFITSCDNSSGNPKINSATKSQELILENDTSIQAIIADTKFRMDSEQDANSDRRFAQLMIFYNEAALSITNILLHKSSNADLLKYSKDKIRKQKDAINEMTIFLQREPDEKRPSSTDFNTAVNKAVLKLTAPYNLSFKSIEQQFIEAMILHHQSSIETIEAEIMYGSHQTLKIHARNMIAGEKEEIDWMQDWLKNNFPKLL